MKQYAPQRRALVLEVKRLKREVQIAKGQLGMARINSWVNATKLIAFLSILKAASATAQRRLVTSDKDLGND